MKEMKIFQEDNSSQKKSSGISRTGNIIIKIIFRNKKSPFIPTECTPSDHQLLALPDQQIH
jgi:hypothetical protein